MPDDDPRLERAARLLAQARGMRTRSDELLAEAFALIAEAKEAGLRQEEQVLQGDGHSD